jgi:predicted metal-binding membrane protein
MAKKAKRKLEEEEEEAFEFPVFDDAAFVKKEFALATGLGIASGFAVGVGLIAFGLTLAGLQWWAPFALGILLTAATPFLLRRIQSQSSQFTKGDWVGLIFLVFFGYLAIWLVLVDVTAHMG